MTTKPLTRIPLCGDCDEGWICDEDGNLVERCPCRTVTKTGTQLRDEGIRKAERANPQQTKAARQIVADAVYLHEEFSANAVRKAMTFAQITNTNVIGGAFLWAAAQGLIENTGRTEQSDEPTTRHRISIWKSLRYGQAKEAS